MLTVCHVLVVRALTGRQVGNLVDVISSRPKNRSGFPMSLVGGHLHVVLAMVANDEDGQDSGFEPRSLRRMIEELCHEVGAPFTRHAAGLCFMFRTFNTYDG